MTKRANAKNLLVSALGICFFTAAQAFVLTAPMFVKVIVVSGVALTSSGMIYCYYLFKEES